MDPMRGPDYIVDIERLSPPATPESSVSGTQGNGFQGRPWISVKWKCCSVYSRIYRNKVGDAYEGKCPKCATPVSAKVGPGGTDARFFEAG